MSETKQDRLTFEAEQEWADALGIDPWSRRQVLSVLYRKLLPPPIAERVVLKVQEAPVGRGQYVEHASTLVLAAGPIYLTLPDPCEPYLLTHEVSHVLADVWTWVPRKDHDDQFRCTHGWVARQVFGLQRARLLGAAYDLRGLSY